MSNPEILSYTVPDFAKAVGLGKSKIWEMIKEGRLRAFMLEGRRLIPATEAKRLIEDAMSRSRAA